MEPKFTPEIDLKDCTMVVHTEGIEDIAFCGRLIVQGRFVHLYGNKVEKPEITTAFKPETSASGITSVLTESALVRLLYDEKIVTAGVTHITAKAWRLYNTELGWCWIPKNILRWSPQINQFCIVESSYFPVFHQEGSFSNEIPHFVENPRKLVDLLYED